MKWLVRRLRKNDYITFEGKNIKEEPTEIEVQDNPSTIRSVNNTLNRLINEDRIEVLSGNVTENPQTPGRAIESNTTTETRTEVTPDGKEKVVEKVVIRETVDISDETKAKIEKILA